MGLISPDTVASLFFSAEIPKPTNIALAMELLQVDLSVGQSVGISIGPWKKLRYKK